MSTTTNRVEGTPGKSAALRIAIASGKGGTGKTTLATNLAMVLADQGDAVAYVDCDVEEPNGHIFLRPTIRHSRPVNIPVPQIDESKCTSCGACGVACRHSAILLLKDTVLTFPQLCHGCGGCSLACPSGAISEVPRPIGVVEEGMSGAVAFLQGRLDIGEAMAPPIIKAVVEASPPDRTLILDSPPGTSCPVIECVKSADVVLLVTEPTPFGLNDLKLAVEMVRALGIPFGVAVNRAGIGDREVFEYCVSEDIAVLMEVPDDRRIAQAYSRGEMVVQALPELRPLFADLANRLGNLAREPHGEIVAQVRPQLGPDSPHTLPSEELPSGLAPPISELVVISGKGGTGKTSIVSSFVALSRAAVVADCDVDAADLHLVLGPSIQKQWPFSGGHEAVIDGVACDGCELCFRQCRYEAIRADGAGGSGTFRVDPISCEGCGVCADNCPQDAVKMVPSLNGHWFVSDTRHGPMVHARLGIAQENSGKLVSLVRREAMAVARLNKREMVIIDASPGIGCPVIASITGADVALVVTEPTLSGLHDMKRVATLARHFNTKTCICINKADINPELSELLEEEAQRIGLSMLGRIRYDPAVTQAQVNRRSVVENGVSPAAQDIRKLWVRVRDEIGL